MEQQERAVLVIASRLLSYPTGDMHEEQSAIEACIKQTIYSSALKLKLTIASSSILDLSEQARKETYVATFDLKSKLGLYLTAHEFGDSNKRGAALIQLQKTISEAGFERAEGELADYIPMLLEYLAVSTEDTTRLARRLAVALTRMRNSIAGDNPYAVILYVLMEFVFPEPTTAEIDKLEFEREEADLENMPYPIMYQ